MIHSPRQWARGKSQLGRPRLDTLRAPKGGAVQWEPRGEFRTADGIALLRDWSHEPSLKRRHLGDT